MEDYGQRIELEEFFTEEEYNMMYPDSQLRADLEKEITENGSITLREAV